MKSVYKYTLDIKESNVIELPLFSEVLSVESQGENIVVYGLVNTEQKETISYDFRTYGTGHIIEFDLKEYKFLGTVKMYNGGLMFHVFNKQITA